MRTTCRNCGKPDWRGCGAHIDSVLGDVPRKQRCCCRNDGSHPSQQSLGKTLSAWLGLRRG